MDRREFLGKALGLTVVTAAAPGIFTCACSSALAKNVPLAFAPITVDLNDTKYAKLKNINGSVYVDIPGGISTRELILNRLSQTEFAVMTSVCPHKGSRVGLWDADSKHPEVMYCTSDHGSSYDLEGLLQTGPSESDLERYRATFDGDHLVIIEDLPATVDSAEFSTAINQVHPNPFSGRTTIDLSMTKDATVDLSLYDMLGNKVATIHDGTITAGEHSFVYDGSALAAGSYFLRLISAKGSAIRLVHVVR